MCAGYCHKCNAKLIPKEFDSDELCWLLFDCLINFSKRMDNWASLESIKEYKIRQIEFAIEAKKMAYRIYDWID